MTEHQYLTMEQLEEGLEHIRQSPKDNGTLEMIVRRPNVDEREVVNEGLLDLQTGLAGDNWKTRGSARMPDKSAHPEMQVTLMSSRVIQLLAQSRDRWQWAGDQLYVDLDLSVENLPPGTRLAIGAAIVEVTAQPHNGCSKFAERFGKDAMKFVNADKLKHLRMRGIHTKIIQPGLICAGDKITKL